MRLKLLCASLIGVLSLAATPARTAPVAPIVDNPAAPLSSSNVQLLASFPEQGATGGRFAGKYFFMTSTGGSVLTAGPSGGLRIFDVSNPELPVLAGVLPLPHYENEDVDVSLKRGVVLISMDDGFVSQVPVGGALVVVDIRDVTKPVIRYVLEYPHEAGRVKDPSSPTGERSIGGPGHIANCVLDCLYAYVGGARDGSIYVVDLRDLDKPRIAGKFISPAGYPNATFVRGTVHDVNVDRFGYIWATGSGGTAMYAPVTARTVTKPKLVAVTSPADNARYDQFIHHNSLRIDGKTVLVTEEDWEQPQCGHEKQEPLFETTGEQGSFQVWNINRSRLTPVGTWKTELGTYLDGGAAVTIVCSSHWFSYNRHRIVAVGWYNQGVRFLDVSNPRAIRQVGYFMGPHTTASAALFVPGRSDLVYVPDYTRGLDILKIDAGGFRARTVGAPVRAEWFTTYGGVRFTPPVRPDPVFGWACLRPSGSAVS